MRMPLVTKEEAVAAGQTRYFTGLPCQHGHVAERIVSSGRCHECHRLRKQQLRADTPEKYRAKSREKYQANPRQFRSYRKNYYARCPEIERERRKEYYHNNREIEVRRNQNWKAANKARVRDTQRRWYEANFDKVLATNSSRRAGVDRASPSWVDKKQIEVIYKKCKQLSEATGIKHHVDHIVPLKNKIVCGLHVPWNLQIIPAEDNLKKRNKFSHDQ